MKHEETGTFIGEMRRLYAAGELPQWQIKRLERIPGWSWYERAEYDSSETAGAAV